MVVNISHLPPDLREGIEDYDKRVADGQLTFDGEFARFPGGEPDAEMEFYSSKLPAMDITRG